MKDFCWIAKDSNGAQHLFSHMPETFKDRTGTYYEVIFGTREWIDFDFGVAPGECIKFKFQRLEEGLNV